MGIAHRYQALLEDHRGLESEIIDELKRPMPDSIQVQRLKRRKLRIKDELAAIERLLEAIDVRPDAAEASVGRGRRRTFDGLVSTRSSRRVAPAGFTGGVEAA